MYNCNEEKTILVLLFKKGRRSFSDLVCLDSAHQTISGNKEVHLVLGRGIPKLS
jgi:hypothetical protein